MGNSSAFILLWLSISLVLGIMTLSIREINPSSSALLSNTIFNRSDNAIYSQLSGDTYRPVNNTAWDSLGGTSSTVSSTGFAFPDWIRSGWSFITSTTAQVGGFGRTIIDLVGAPYTIFSKMGINAELAALLGAFWGLLGTIAIYMLLTGKDN